MNKKVLTIVSGILIISMAFNIYLFTRVDQLSKKIINNSNRLQYLESNIDNTIADVIKDDGYLDSILEDVNWNVSELISEEEKTALLHIDFKLRSMDSTSKVYASIEAGDEEAVLVEAHLLNDTTYTVDREINVLKPVRIDLVVEKYGEKRLENLVDEDEIYKTYIADTAFNLLDFDYDYNLSSGTLSATYGAEVVFASLKNIDLVRSDIVVEKNGVLIDKRPMIMSQVKYPDAVVYENDVKDHKLEAKELDSLNFAVILKDKQGFTYRYDFASFKFMNGAPVMTTTSLPELTLN
ncbi:hypothetical protein [Proteiniclasticum sp.]|uniref:hypothetical protein n=1 Tax=Proteiniclasticum sp. TaxID=2053595 RepID=UPI00289CC0EC|nr:hypothetical protein [Proteiniclasticum sp.]